MRFTVTCLALQKAAFYGIIASVIVAAGVGIMFAAMSMSNAAEPVVANQQQQNISNNEVRIIKHAMGETEIAGTPERIVALEWSASEILLTMGVQPIAVADIEGMKKFLRPEGLSSDITDIGTVQEPNLEAIAELEPDLIIAEKWGQSALYDERYCTDGNV